MKIPNKIKIGGHEYKIKYHRMPDDQSCGVADYGKGTIYIDTELIKSEQERVFFHEALHIINHELTETDVDFLAQALYAFLKENKLLRWKKQRSAKPHQFTQAY